MQYCRFNSQGKSKTKVSEAKGGKVGAKGTAKGGKGTGSKGGGDSLGAKRQGYGQVTRGGEE